MPDKTFSQIAHEKDERIRIKFDSLSIAEIEEGILNSPVVFPSFCCKCGGNLGVGEPTYCDQCGVKLSGAAGGLRCANSKCRAYGVRAMYLA